MKKVLLQVTLKNLNNGDKNNLLEEEVGGRQALKDDHFE